MISRKAQHEAERGLSRSCRALGIRCLVLKCTGKLLKGSMQGNEMIRFAFLIRLLWLDVGGCIKILFSILR